MASPRMGKRRRDNDVIKLIQSNYPVTMLEGDQDLCVRFRGPRNSLYEGGVWNVRLHVGEDYPFKSPSVGFMNRIFHPNIDEASGTICMNVLNQSWTPLYDLISILETFLPQLLAYPNPHDPLNKTAASLLLLEPEKYQAVVKHYVSKFATEDVLRREMGASSSDESTMSDSDEH